MVRRQSLLTAGPALELLVPLVAFVDDAPEPAVDSAHERGQSHAAALGEMAELVGQNTAKLADREAGDERQANGERQIPPQKAERPRQKPRGRVDLAVDLHSRGNGRAHMTANLLDEGEEHRLGIAVERNRVPSPFRPRQYGLDQEEDDHNAGDGRAKIRQDLPEAAGAAFENPQVRCEVPPDGQACEHDEAEVHQRQQQHRYGDHDEAQAVCRRESCWRDGPLD